MIRLKILILWLLLPITAMPAVSHAQNRPLSLRDSFPIGNSGGILCQVQDRSLKNKAKQSIFDRSWSVVCRDSARPVGTVYAFRSPNTDVIPLIANQRRESITCPASGSKQSKHGFEYLPCKLSNEPVAYSVFRLQDGETLYIAEGFTAYDDATTLALQSITNDKIADGTIDVASTSIEDPFAFARVQASTLKPEQALAEGYRRNLSGDYAEAAAFFETLQQRTAGLQDETIDPEEYLINRALQKSNLGEFAEADELFKQSRTIGSNNIVTQRLRRNFEGIHLLNQGRYEEAISRINLPVKATSQTAIALTTNLQISKPISSRINGGGKSSILLGFTDDLKLSEQERAEIIDAQALQLIGTAQRINGDSEAANLSLTTAYNRALAVRDGRVTSITRLRAQILSELASLAEKRGEFGEAQRYLSEGLELLSLQYPETRAVNGAKARLASFFLRRGNNSEARALYREVVDSSLGKRGAITGIANQLAPYFRLIADDEEATGEFFKATQILTRPGVSETNAVLSRELSAGTDDAARLFRQSTNLARSIERSRIRFSGLRKLEQTLAIRTARSELASKIEALERSQQLTQIELSKFPQYRAVAASSMGLSEFQSILEPDEAYIRMAIVGGGIFMFYADHEFATAYRTDIDARELDEKVDFLRASISTLEDGRYVTYPFEIAASRTLYKSLFDPVADRVSKKKHLIFEPDGAMLRLPINLFVTDDASVNSYLTKVEEPDGDPYDYTGVAWLGSDTDISTAVSARAFADARQAPSSKATRQYLGMGKNRPLGPNISAARNRSLAEASDTSCSWAKSEWNKPISDAELIKAQSIIGANNSELLTEKEFTDSNILNKANISDYRILHFATHGLVTAPKPSCPAKPALLTSFGDEDSDGLLAFDEIFDLKIDADIVILSACDTAGKASIQATREAGVSSGGGTALDGLVRSFIGAGGRSVLASHWPAPDDFDATQRLIGDLFSDGAGKSVASALRTSQQKLMNDAITSHPYYWSAFAVVGDGARPFLPDRNIATLPASGSTTGQGKGTSGLE